MISSQENHCDSVQSAVDWHTIMSKLFHDSDIVSTQWSDRGQIVRIINTITHGYSDPVFLPIGVLEYASVSGMRGYIELFAGIAQFIVQPLCLEHLHLKHGSSHFRLILGQEPPGEITKVLEEEIIEIEGKFITKEKFYSPFSNAEHEIPLYRLWGGSIIIFPRYNSILVESPWLG